MSEQKNGLDLSAVMNMLSENPAIIGNLMSALAPKGDPPKNGSEEEIFIALFLLPSGVDVGTRLHYEWLTYTIIA